MIMILPTGHILNFNIGQIVFLKTDINQDERLVIKIQLMPNKGVMYMLSLGETSEWFYDIEISEDKDQIKKLT